jgi:HD superfamily phosphodiesterase
VENKENNLLKRISELEKSLESLEERSGLLNDEIKNVKGAITALKSDAGIEVKKAAAPEYIEVSSEIVAAQQAAPKSSVAEPPRVQENPRVLKRQQKVAERMAAREARRNAAAERREGVSLEQFKAAAREFLCGDRELMLTEDDVARIAELSGEYEL